MAAKKVVATAPVNKAAPKKKCTEGRPVEEGCFQAGCYKVCCNQQQAHSQNFLKDACFRVCQEDGSLEQGHFPIACNLLRKSISLSLTRSMQSSKYFSPYKAPMICF